MIIHNFENFIHTTVIVSHLCLCLTHLFHAPENIHQDGGYPKPQALTNAEEYTGIFELSSGKQEKTSL